VSEQRLPRGGLDPLLRERRVATATSGLPAASFQNHAAQLQRRHFIHIAYYSEIPPDISIQPPGSQWLEEHDLMPE
jgi:hypothetical protein